MKTVPEIDWKRVDALIKMALDEDLGDRGDTTTIAVIDDSLHVEAVFLAKEECICAGLCVAERLMKTVDPTVEWESLVGEGIKPEFIALINYGIVGLIQLDKGYTDQPDMTSAEAMDLYDAFAGKALQLMLRKNHDYDEAWRSMRVSSYTDLILTKILRVKEIEDLNGATLVSEGIDSNYMDIINYAVFGVIKLSFE